MKKRLKLGLPLNRYPGYAIDQQKEKYIWCTIEKQREVIQQDRTSMPKQLFYKQEEKV